MTFDIGKFKKIDLVHAQTPIDGEVVQVHVDDYWFIYQDKWILTNR